MGGGDKIRSMTQQDWASASPIKSGAARSRSQGAFSQRFYIFYTSYIGNQHPVHREIRRQDDESELNPDRFD